MDEITVTMTRDAAMATLWAVNGKPSTTPEQFGRHAMAMGDAEDAIRAALDGGGEVRQGPSAALSEVAEVGDDLFDRYLLALAELARTRKERDEARKLAEFYDLGRQRAILGRDEAHRDRDAARGALEDMAVEVLAWQTLPHVDLGGDEARQRIRILSHLTPEARERVTARLEGE